MTSLFKRALAAAGFVFAVLTVSPAAAQNIVRFVMEDKACTEGSSFAIDSDGGSLNVRPSKPDSRSAQWLMKPIGDPASHTYELQNRGSGELLVAYVNGANLEFRALAPDAQISPVTPKGTITRALTADDTAWTISEQSVGGQRKVTISRINVHVTDESVVGKPVYFGTDKCSLKLSSQPESWRFDDLGPAVAPREPDYVWLRRAGTPQAVHIETGAPQLSALGGPGWWSAQWEMKKVSAAGEARGVVFINRWTKKGLARAGEGLAMVDVPADYPGPEKATFVWNVVPGPQGSPGVALQNGDRYLALSRDTGKLTMSKPDYSWSIEYRAPGVPAPAPAPAPERIVQIWVGTDFVLNVEHGPVSIDKVKPGDTNPPSVWWSGMWALVDLGVDSPNNPKTQFFAMRNRHTHKYLAVVDRQIVVTDARPNVAREQLPYAWKTPLDHVSNSTGFRSLQNVVSGAYLDVNAREPVNMRSLKLSDQPAVIWMQRRMD